MKIELIGLGRNKMQRIYVEELKRMSNEELAREKEKVEKRLEIQRQRVERANNKASERENDKKVIEKLEEFLKEKLSKLNEIKNKSRNENSAVEVYKNSKDGLNDEDRDFASNQRTQEYEEKINEVLDKKETDRKINSEAKSSKDENLSESLNLNENKSNSNDEKSNLNESEESNKTPKEIDNIYSINDPVKFGNVTIQAQNLAMVAYKTGEYELYKDLELVAKTDPKQVQMLQKYQALQKGGEKENENKDLILAQMKEQGLSNIDLKNPQALMTMDPNYLAKLQAKLPPAMIDGEEVALATLNPKELELAAKQEGNLDLAEMKDQKDYEENTEKKMEENLGLDIRSSLKIVDNSFTDEIIGHQTGYSNQYIVMTTDGVFHLVGEYADGSIEENPEFLPAKPATTDEQPEYNEKGEIDGDSEVRYIMRRKDGKPSKLALDYDMYGRVTVMNRSNPEDPTPIKTTAYKPTEEDYETNIYKETNGKYETIEAEEEAREKEAEEQKLQESQAREQTKGNEAENEKGQEEEEISPDSPYYKYRNGREEREAPEEE